MGTTRESFNEDPRTDPMPRLYSFPSIPNLDTWRDKPDELILQLSQISRVFNRAAASACSQSRESALNCGGRGT
eukprot:3817970-Rhodomonas_salina.3